MAEEAMSEVQDRSIGDIIRDIHNLSAEQIDSILDYQRQKGVRFGEAAVALGLVSGEDVVFALSQQFHYPYTPVEHYVHPELVTASQPFGSQAEAFRAIRSQLINRVFNAREPKRALAVISSESGDGKTFFVANLGIVLAQMGGRTLVVDANLRNPRLHELFGVSNTSGLSGILSGRQEDNVIYQVTDIPSLYVMPVGVTPPNPLELLERPAFRLLMTELLRRFDHVVVDTAASSLGSDACVVVAKCGAALTVARKDRTRTNKLTELVDAASGVASNMVGVVFNQY
ncbi:polysaccharide biosynthesis tyrosine autokinase [uncultured Sphaerotilus sp.]|uniref:polysaccharide biosynthesis tyrosine autokinase n=1 Tax=uncultured Sphaerotilus sp. TaxID=474984 RepID=UPI0030CA43EC